MGEGNFIPYHNPPPPISTRRSERVPGRDGAHTSIPLISNSLVELAEFGVGVSLVLRENSEKNEVPLKSFAKKCF